MDEHHKHCRKRGAYKNVTMRNQRHNIGEQKLGNLKECLIDTCKVQNLNKADVLFYLLREELKDKNVSLSKNIDKLYEYFTLLQLVYMRWMISSR